MNIGWPEGIWIALAVLAMLLAALTDGTERAGKNSLALSMLSHGLMFLLLWWGGFFA